jgi:hypothetical protein
MHPAPWSIAKLASLALWLALPGAGAVAQTVTPLPTVELYAPSACPACAAWVKQLRQRGFVVTQEEKSPDGMRRIKHWVNVPSALESVLTARVGGYFIEGSVPVDDVLRLLKEKPLARGLGLQAVPGGAPGREKFNTIFVGADGGTRLYAQH